MSKLIDPFHGDVLDPVEQKQINTNVVLVTAVLDTLVESTLEHLQSNGAQCVRACCGNASAQVTVDMLEENPKVLVALAQLAVRRLAELQYEKELLS